MTYPSVQEFEELLRTRPLGDVLMQHVLSGTPFVFRDTPDDESLLRAHLREQLGAGLEAVRIVGSGRIGFSLNPNNFPRHFSPASDIDVLVVDKDLFDEVWLTMLKWNYPHRRGLPKDDIDWQKARQNDLYWGWFHPDRIRYEGLSRSEQLSTLRDLSVRWFNAFQSLSVHTQFANRSSKGRLYRSWKHALLYHSDGLRQIKGIVS